MEADPRPARAGHDRTAMIRCARRPRRRWAARNHWPTRWTEGHALVMYTVSRTHRLFCTKRVTARSPSTRMSSPSTCAGTAVRWTEHGGDRSCSMWTPRWPGRARRLRKGDTVGFSLGAASRSGRRTGPAPAGRGGAVSSPARWYPGRARRCAGCTGCWSNRTAAPWPAARGATGPAGPSCRVPGRGAGSIAPPRCCW